MDLKNFLPNREKAHDEYFWSLIIEPGWVQSGVWRIKENKVQIINIGPSTAWGLDEELVGAVDACLSSAIQDFPEDIGEPQKTVFGVNSSWVTEGQIKEEYLVKIKKICSELSLTPVGFVVLPEAIANYFKSEDGVPLNAIVLGISKDTLELSLFRLGNLVGISQISRSVSVVDDVSEGLTRFASNEAFPSRVIIYDGKEGELEEVRQDLIRASWEDYGKIKFLHTPKVEILDPERKLYAVCLAGGAELGHVEAVVPLARPEEPETVPPSLATEEIDNVAETAEEFEPTDFGFALNEDVTEQQKVAPVSEEITSDRQQPQELPPNSPPTTHRPKKRFIPSFSFAGLRTRISGEFGGLKRPRLNFTGAGKPLFLGLFFFVVILIAGFAFWWFYPKATVSIFISTKRLDDKIAIYIDPSVTSPDFEKSTLPGEVLKVTVDGEKTGSVTGTKVVGDKATGEITIYRSGSEVNLAAGTAIHGPGGLDFSLDNDVKVASGSVITRGVTKTKVSAKDIGAQYNLASGATFTVGTYSSADMEGTNETAFSGGSSREINAVAEDDQNEFLDNLTNEMEEKATGELEQQLGEDKILIKDSLKTEITDKTFNYKVGDEASSLKLNLTIDVTAISINKSSLTEMAKKTLTGRVPQGFSLKDDQITTEFEVKEEKDGIYEVSVVVSADLLPQVDPDEVTKNILGKYPTLAEDYFTQNIPGFVRAEIKFNKPRLPGRLGTLPRVSKNIDVIVSAEK